MKIKIIKERKQLGTIYHFTTFKGITNILLTNEFQGSEANVDKEIEKKNFLKVKVYIVYIIFLLLEINFFIKKIQVLKVHILD